MVLLSSFILSKDHQQGIEKEFHVFFTRNLSFSCCKVLFLLFMGLHSRHHVWFLFLGQGFFVPKSCPKLVDNCLFCRMSSINSGLDPKSLRSSIVQTVSKKNKTFLLTKKNTATRCQRTQAQRERMMSEDGMMSNFQNEKATLTQQLEVWGCGSLEGKKRLVACFP